MADVAVVDMGLPWIPIKILKDESTISTRKLKAGTTVLEKSLWRLSSLSQTSTSTIDMLTTQLLFNVIFFQFMNKWKRETDYDGQRLLRIQTTRIQCYFLSVYEQNYSLNPQKYCCLFMRCWYAINLCFWNRTAHLDSILRGVQQNDVSLTFYRGKCI